MLKKIFVGLVFVFLITNNAFATEEYVSGLENKLFGKNYANENYTQRVDRIEREIYGKNYIGNSEERLEKIYKIYPQEEILNIKSYSNNTYYQNENVPEEYNEYNDYPIVTMLEEQTLLKSYKNEDIYKRLDRLEQKIYGNTQNNLSLNERVENLKSRIKITKNNNIDKDSYYTDNNNYYNNEANSRISNILKEMEYETFSHAFPSDNSNTRINRLEKYYFGTYQDNMPEKQRLTKLAKVITKKYDSNNYSKSYSDMTRIERNAQWAELIMNLLIIGLGLIL